MPTHSMSERPGALMEGDANTLRELLTSINGRGYGSYKQLKGAYDLGACRLVADYGQVDPYAPPS